METRFKPIYRLVRKPAAPLKRGAVNQISVQFWPQSELLLNSAIMVGRYSFKSGRLLAVLFTTAIVSLWCRRCQCYKFHTRSLSKFESKFLSRPTLSDLRYGRDGSSDSGEQLFRLFVGKHSTMVE